MPRFCLSFAIRQPQKFVWLSITFMILMAGSVTAIAEDTSAPEHWAFRPVQRPVTPAVKHAELVASPIDAFILEKLEAAGLEPAGIADKRTLIRRASYDLIGLPPTPAEVADFLADDSPRAFDTVVNRLLASPHYGERWGRYWLDVARYANTRGDTGTDDNVSPFAYTYRDYVIRAFNEDLPYDQFLIQQIAADQLEHPENSPTLAALGFVTVGRHFRSNVHDTMDDRIDVITRGTMALTVSCARCHDHKYDPIPTKDYYSLYGVLASSNEPSPLPIIGTPEPTAFVAYQTQRQKLETDRAELIRNTETEVNQRHQRLTAEFLLATRRPPKAVAPGQPDDEASDENNLRRSGVRRWRKALDKLNTENDPVFAPWFAFAALPEAEFADRARELSAKVAANGLSHPVNPIVAMAFAGDPPTSLKDVADRYGKLLNDLASQPPTDSADQIALRKALLENDAPGHIPQDALRKLFPQKAQSQIQHWEAELSRLELEHPGAPQRAMALTDNSQPQNARVFVRGNPNNSGEEVPRQFVEVVAGKSRQPFTRGSGRLELARAIASPDNPLTARVIVNRVWMHHFGEGLVTTPDDFGLRSDPPSHPQLLDYLASRFMDEGWSLKKLHRLIMLSRTYRQQSDDALRSETADPSNRLLSKMNRRRLDFESLRDTLVYVTGSMDQSIGGRPVELVPQPRVSAAGIFSAPAKDQPPSLRRAIYGFIDRQNLPGLLRVFDFADPDACTGRRYVTTVPQQALFFFNSPFVMQQAKRLVSQADFQGLDTPQRIQYLYQRVFQRGPEADEVELASKFIAGLPSTDNTQPLRAWELLAHVLLMSDELIFVD